MTHISQSEGKKWEIWEKIFLAFWKWLSPVLTLNKASRSWSGVLDILNISLVYIDKVTSTKKSAEICIEVHFWINFESEMENIDVEPCVKDPFFELLESENSDESSSEDTEEGSPTLSPGIFLGRDFYAYFSWFFSTGHLVNVDKAYV